MQRYDSTATNAVDQLADNLIANLMPPHLNWCSLVAGANHDKLNSSQKQTLQYYENTLFDKLNESNFYREVHGSLMEMSISTGVLLIKETNDFDNPFTFESIPLHTCCFGGSPGTSLITDVYRELKVEGRLISTIWPKAKLNKQTMDNIAEHPTSELKFVEGTYFDPSKPENSQYCYFVIDLASKEIILKELRSYSPWLVFRQQHLAGELLGRGVLYGQLPLLRTITVCPNVSCEQKPTSVYQSF